MQFEFKNLGTIKEAQIEMGDLTIICGENNTGKTYLTYAVWGVLIYETPLDMTRLFLEDIIIKLSNEDILQKLEKDGYYKLNVEEEIYKEYYDYVNGMYQIEIRDVLDAKEEYLPHLITKVKKDQKQKNKNIVSEISFQKELPQITIEILKSKNADVPNSLSEKQIFDAIDSLLFPERDLFKQAFLLPAQRDSIELFYKEVDKNRYNIVEAFKKDRNIDSFKDAVSRFPKPIEKLIDFARDLTRQVVKTKSFIQKDHPELLQEIEEILGVKYEVLGDEVVIKDGTAQLPAYMASTSVRSLMHLYFWLKHKAQKGDLLMIDEPELNLHPKNQIRMARLFAKLINVGVKIWITTHSDYIIKELNNCLMLSQDFDDKEETLKRLGYKSNEILKQEQVKAYIAKYDENLKGCTVVPVEYDDYGMVMTTFDEQIDQINAISEELSDAIYDKKLSKQDA